MNFATALLPAAEATAEAAAMTMSWANNPSERVNLWNICPFRYAWRRKDFYAFRNKWGCGNKPHSFKRHECAIRWYVTFCKYVVHPPDPLEWKIRRFEGIRITWQQWNRANTRPIFDDAFFSSEWVSECLCTSIFATFAWDFRIAIPEINGGTMKTVGEAHNRLESDTQTTYTRLFTLSNKEIE